jgi:GNAT superfamily N-acetyltransferase
LHGHIDITGDGSGVALWFERGVKPVPAIPHYRQRLRDIFGDFVDGFHDLDEATEAHHPQGPPHLYLQHLAVHPDRQGQGHGTRLLEYLNGVADELEMPCYLEATGGRNVLLYLRHGYVRRPRFTIGGPHGPSLFPMWRFPGGDTAGLGGDERWW